MTNPGRRYHFVSRWTVDAPADAAYAAIHEVTSYPAWWPEVKETRKLDVVRPAYSANHTLMMAHGQAGLRTFLAGYTLARRPTG